MPLFYSLPPAGQKIPFGVLAKCAVTSVLKRNKKPIEHLKYYLGCEQLLYLYSGRAALWLALKTLTRLSPGRNEVIIPAYSCPSIISATLKAGLKPVLCDINLNDFGYLYEELERTVSAKTLAVIVVHLYGSPVKLVEIQHICNAKGAYIVEDAAQAFGNDFPDSPDVKLGLSGDVGFYSFGRGKPLNIMHGGLLTTKLSEVYQEAEHVYESLNGCSRYQSMNYCLSLGTYALFSNPYLYWLPQMLPFLDLGGTVFEPEFAVSKGLDLAASLASLLVDMIEKEKSIRRENSKWYSDHLKEIYPGERQAPGEYPYLRYPLLILDEKKRRQILETLVSKGTGATGSYPTPLNELPKLKDVLADSTKYENARIMSESIITLPVHSRVTEKDRENIGNIIKQVLHEN